MQVTASKADQAAQGKAVMPMMKMFLTLTFAALMATPALAQRYSSYDSQSDWTGTGIKRGSTLTGYDRSGRPNITAVKRGNTITLNERGVGRSTVNVVTQGNTSTVYRSGRVVGRIIHRGDGSSTFYHPNGAPGVTTRRVGP
jgi:hypothetical protein